MTTEFTFDYDLYSDLHKDAYGFRPHGSRFYDEDTTDADRQWLWDMAIKDLDAAIIEEEARQQEAIASFEKSITDSIAMGAADRATAIKWQIQAGGYEHEYDAGYICYCLGLPYHKGYEEEFLPFINKEFEEVA